MLKKAQERQKKAYDAKHQPQPFKVGYVVLLKNMKNKDRKGGTLEPVWSGPYTVSNVMLKGVYKLSNKGGTELKKPVNSARLKIYHEPLGKQPSQVELTKADRRDFDLILSNAKLDDNVINRAQRILREQFNNISGWQDTILSQTSFVPVKEECIQIHHTGHDHWVCSTSINGFVRLYDSMHCKQLTPSMKVQLSQCYHTLVKNNLLEVELPPRQIQPVNSTVVFLQSPSLLNLQLVTPTHRMLPTTKAKCVNISSPVYRKDLSNHFLVRTPRTLYHSRNSITIVKLRNFVTA
ncbi:Hypothetical predicted protein [Paramuricea clavata]|uniref:Uncharacterized protein n=1 Tax=Paramuricea clavata TaxID=317549 RepID=A0A6S7FSA2_PARCT|nr:Hypothetical predicted protein [Paramuricea clavata]